MDLQKLATALLNDALLYLTVVEKELYCSPIALLSEASIGQHSRHFIEFFQALLQQYQSQAPLVNYDLRLRNKQIEIEPLFAVKAVKEIIQQLDQSDFPHALQLQATFENDTLTTIGSTFKRELLYNIEHTIHHLAIIKIGLKIIAPHLVLPVHFGVAASTTRYRETICAP